MTTMSRRRAQISVFVGVLMLMTLLTASSANAGEPQQFPALTPDGEPLRAAFNRDAGRVRLLFFIDPT